MVLFSLTARFLIQAVPTTETSIESKEAWQAMTEAAKAQEFRLSVVFPDVNGTDAPQSQGYNHFLFDLDIICNKEEC